MSGFLLVRGLFVGAVVYAAGQIQPFEGHMVLNAACGLAVALCIIAAETRMRDVAVTQLLGALLGFGVMLVVARQLSGALFWANTSDTKVRFLHSLIIIVLPYLETRQSLPRRAPAETLQDSRYQRHHRWPHR
jgi:hypothetical protein